MSPHILNPIRCPAIFVLQPYFYTFPKVVSLYKVD